MQADYIVIGSGPAGAAVAYSLSENPKNTVILLEAGGENSSDLNRPAMGAPLFFKTDADWNYETTPQPGLNNRVLYEPRGKMLGGCSVLNGAYWARGCEADYDQWEKMGLEGWNGKIARETFVKVENSDRGVSDPKYRGADGVVMLEVVPRVTKLADTLMTAFVEAGFGGIGDINGETPFCIDQTQTLFKDKYRHTMADDFLNYNVRKRPNLKVITGAFATKILFDGTKATGIQFTQNGAEQTVTANKEIVLSAGAFNTPMLLMWSGIGPIDHLKDMNIPILADLPGVGSGMHDHVGASVNVIAPKGMTGTMWGSNSPEAMLEWRFTRSGPATYFDGNNVSFIALDPNAKIPDAELITHYDYSKTDTAGNPLFKGIDPSENRSGYSALIVLLHPKSEGTVRLRSANPNDKPIIDPNFFGNKEDMDKMIALLRKAQQLTKTNALAPYTEQVNPPLDATDEEMAAFVSANSYVVHHASGTARMAVDSDPMGVVNNRLQVRGFQGLRVADASVMPTLNSGHTMAPSVFIGMQCAKFILEDNQ